jgi:hypothetical protein
VATGRWAHDSPLVWFSLRPQRIQRGQGTKRASRGPEHNPGRGEDGLTAPWPECVRAAVTKALMRGDTGGAEHNTQHGSGGHGSDVRGGICCYPSVHGGRILAQRQPLCVWCRRDSHISCSLRYRLGILLLFFNDLHLRFRVSPIPFLCVVLPVSKLMDQLIILEVSLIWGFGSYLREHENGSQISRLLIVS